MYPNPQDALPLPARPNVEQYKKLAKDLVKACKSGDPAATRLWSIRWVRSLAALQCEPDALKREGEITERAARHTLEEPGKQSVRHRTQSSRPLAAARGVC